MALIAELHSLPSVDLAPPLDVTPQRKKDKTFEALLRQIEGLARQQPVLMVFDDLHWIDPSSRELLDRVIERVADWPVLLLAMFRPEFQPPWTGQPHVTMLTLARLDRRDTAAMVANVAGNAALPPEIVEEIAERTDGVPLFVEELTKAVLESGAQGAAALSSVPHPALSVPATLHASLMARLDRLGPAAKDVAQTGAAIGREFGFELLASITDLPEPQLHEALDRLTNAGLLFVRGTPPEVQLHLQARAGAGCGLRHIAAQPAPAAARSNCRDPRRPLSGDRVGATRVVGPALRGSRAGGKGGRLLAEGRSTGAGALGDDGSGRPVAEGIGGAGRLPDGPWRQQQELDLQTALGSALTATAGCSAADVERPSPGRATLAEQLDRPEHLVPLIVGQWTFHLCEPSTGWRWRWASSSNKSAKCGTMLAAQLLGRYLHGVSRLHARGVRCRPRPLERCMGLADPRIAPSLDCLSIPTL